MALDPVVPAPPKNRRGWLIAFGIVEILLACVCFLMAVGVVIMVLVSPHTVGPPGSAGYSVLGALFGGLFYLVLGAVFLALGIGSIRCRTWARIGTQIVSGLWLLTGILTTLFMVFVMPRIMERQGTLPAGQRQLALLIVAVFAGVFMVLLPAILLVFYSLPSVRATCARSGLAAPANAPSEAYPPIPVIVLAVWESLGIFAIASLFFARASVVFGVVVHGMMAVFLMTAVTLVSGIAAWLIYKRDYLGWGISLGKSLFLTVSWLVTILTRDLVEVYHQIGLSEEQLQSIRMLPHFQTMVMSSVFVCFGLYLALLLYTKKYFSPVSAAAA